MTAEQFDRRQWSIKDKVVYRNIIYTIRGIDWDCGTMKINDGVRASITVLFEAVTIYKGK